MRDESFYSHRYDLAFQREIWGAMLRNSTTKYPIARRDPIFTPIFTAILGTGGIAIGATTISFASIASAVAVTALTIGINALLAPKPPKVEAGKNPMTQAIPYRIWGVGRTRLAGAYMLWESKGAQLYAIQAIAAHRIKSFNKFWLHDDLVTLDAGGYVNALSGGRYANSSVQILSRIGLPVETPYAPAVDAFGAGGLWTADHRGDGQASLCMVATATKQKDQQKRFPYHIPQLTAEADLALCWDFRDPAQNPADPGTWTWTQNSALICAWHLCFNEFGFNLDYTKALMPVIELWKEEANICDEDVPLAIGGIEKRYQCNGWETTENGPKAALNTILATCDGHLVQRGDGARILTVGKFRESRCSVLTDADIVGHAIQYDVLFEDECNRLVPKFTYPDTDYTTADTDYFEDMDAQLKAGRVLAQEADYQWCHQWRQARRLAKRDWLRLREKVKGSLDVRLSGLNAVYARWVRLETPKRIPRLNGKIVENRRSVVALTRGGFTMDMVQSPSAIDEWVPAVDEGQRPPVPEAPDADVTVIPVINLVQAKPNGQSVYIRVVILDPADESLTPVVRYRVTDPGTTIPGPWIEKDQPGAIPAGGFIDMATDVVPSDQVLDVQVAFKTAGGNYGDWTATVNVTSIVDPVAPDGVSGVTASGMTAAADFTWFAPNSPNYVGAKIYWNSVNDFGTAIFLAPIEAGAPNVSASATRAISSGTRYAWITSINGSGIESAPVFTGAFVVS